MSLDIESLGFTKEELQSRVIERICSQLLESVGFDEDGDEYPVSSQFKNLIDQRIKQQIDETINAIAEKHILPNVTSYIENLTLQETNRWGESTKEPVTFIEYLARRAESYLQEKVDYEGKTKDECRGFSFNGAQTRITHLVHKHLHYSIETAMKDAMKIATSGIAKGIEETIKVKLAEVQEKLKVEVKV